MLKKEDEGKIGIQESYKYYLRINLFCVQAVLCGNEFVSFDKSFKGDTVILDSKRFDMNMFYHCILF